MGFGAEVIVSGDSWIYLCCLILFRLQQWLIQEAGELCAHERRDVCCSGMGVCVIVGFESAASLGVGVRVQLRCRKTTMHLITAYHPLARSEAVIVWL